MSKYFCPNCGGEMILSLLTCLPPIEESTCTSCLSRFRREKVSEKKEILDKSFIELANKKAKAL